MQLEAKTLEKSSLSQAHPWHGVDPKDGKEGLLVFIENTPLALMKYEVDEKSGILKIDTPLETSSLPPAAYGFVPRTLCGARVAQLNARLRGDRAALDVYVLSERQLEVSGVLAEVRIVGGVAVKDESFVDDKLIAVLCRDAVYGHIEDIVDVPVYALDRICHFLAQESASRSIEVGDPFGCDRANALLQAALDDYEAKYPV